jgi:hypothetical protein
MEKYYKQSRTRGISYPPPHPRQKKKERKTGLVISQDWGKDRSDGKTKRKT